jgi:hypothetical protein
VIDGLLRALLLVVMGALTLVPSVNDGIDLQAAFLLSMMILAAAAWLLLHSGRAWHSASFVFFGYVCMYHFTTALSVLFIPGARDRWPIWVIGWIFTPAASEALLLCTSALVAFAVAASAIRANRSASGTRPGVATSNWGIEIVGLAVLSGGAVLLAVSLWLGGGASRLLQDTVTFRTEVIHGSVYTVAIYFIGQGFLLAVAGCPRKRLPVAVVPFGICAALLLVSGNRGEALYPSLAAVILIRRRFGIPSGAVMTAGVVATIAAVTVVGAVRSVGVAYAAEMVKTPDARDGLLELGSALRPTTTVVQWLGEGGEAPLYGQSYVLPFERMLGRFLPSVINRLAPEDDPRFVAYQAFQRSGSAMGFSIIAEAVYNFGALGPLIVFLPLGLAFGKLDALTPNSENVALMGVVLFPLINAVRNTFVFVPGQLIAGVALIFIASFIAPPARVRSRPIAGPPPRKN